MDKKLMSKAHQRQDLSVLSNSKRGLVYLTANDWTLIADKAKRLEYKQGDPIVQKGKRTQGVFLLLTGSARVQLASRFRDTVPAISAGEVCGEISFIDDLPATATVLALEPVEAFYLERSVLQALFELFPHLGSRFYRSLASSLSRRLRELIDHEPSASQTQNQ
jgi:CRP-like cAMP-binding protein